MLQISDIKSLFEKEFGLISIKFVVEEYEVQKMRESKDPNVFNPGVYIYWHPKYGVVRIGVSLVNARKRAYEHIDADTGGIMKELGYDKLTRVILYNIKSKEDNHWVIALEKYFEIILKPYIPPGRYG